MQPPAPFFRAFLSWLPRRGSALAAILCIGLALRQAVWQDTPRGNVRGQVVLAENAQSLSKVRVYLTRDVEEHQDDTARGEVQTRWRAVTDKDGRFQLTRLPTGYYHVSASTHAHVGGDGVWIEEGTTATVKIPLKRSQPELQLSQQKDVFTGAEATANKVFLPVHGYVDGNKPAGADTLRVQVWRTRLSDVLRDEDAAKELGRVGQRWGQDAGRLPAQLLKPPHAPVPQLLWQRDVPIKGADREGFYHQRVRLGTIGPGLYLVEIGHAKQAVCSWVQVTDTALILKRAQGQVLAYTVDTQHGAPQTGTTVQIYRAGKVVAQATTSAQGLAWLSVPKAPEGESEESAEVMAVATKNGSEGVIARDDYNYEEQGAYTVVAYTDRPLYRPGQQLFYKGIARRNVEKGARYAIPTGTPVTVEIRDPQGERILREERTANEFGSFSGAATLDPEAPTGTYTLVTTIAGEKHTQDIEVASYRKPEFVVTIKPGQPRYHIGDTVDMTISAQYYFGTPVAGAKVHYEVYREYDWSYEFGEDEEEDLEGDDSGYRRQHGFNGGGETATSGDATLDDKGEAVVRFPAKRSYDEETEESDGEPGGEEAFPPQSQTFTCYANVTDTAGSKREVSAQGDVKVTAGDFRLRLQPAGYVATPGQASTVTAIAQDYDGKPVASVPVRLEYGYWRWDQEEDKSVFALAGARTATTDAVGRAVFEITPPKTGELRLTALAKDARQATVQARDFLWAAGESGGDYGADYPDLALLTDQRRYEPGQTARVLLNANHVGQSVLMTLEGARIYRAWTVPITQRSTVLRLPVLAEYGPNLSLAACYIQKGDFARTETSLRVTTHGREIAVTVTPDRTRLEPGDKVSYTVQTRDAAGHPVPCEVSLGVVDESIYALREDDPTLLRDTFYPRRENNVTTSYSGEMEFLGDADKGAPAINPRKKFEDTAFWQPDLHTDAQGRATVTVTLPDNLTTWRATAIAQTVASTFGRQTSKVLATKDFFVRVEKPRFMTRGDEGRLLALVHNQTGVAQTANVQLEVTGLRTAGELRQTLKLEPGAVGQAVFPVKAETTGAAKITAKAWTQSAGPNGQPFTDGEETTLPVREHARVELSSSAGAVLPGTPRLKNIMVKPEGRPASNRLTIRLAPFVLNAVTGSLDYLVGYPYGCTEQTMSRFLPDIMVQRVWRLTGTHNAKYEAELPKMVRSGLLRLARFQHESGAWGWWEFDYDDPWMTAYVLYGLSIARDEGYPVNPDVLAKGRQAAAKMLAGMKVEYDYQHSARAFLIYAIELARPRPTSTIKNQLAPLDEVSKAMRAARQEMHVKGLPSEALAHLILFDHMTGQRGDTALAEMQRRAILDGGLMHWQAAGNSYYSAWDDKLATASGLRAMLAVNPHDPRVPSVLRWLMANRTEEYWGSTRDTAWVLGALCDYLQAQPQSGAPGGSLRVSLNGSLLQAYQLTADLLSEPEIVLRVPPKLLKPGKNQLTMERVGGSSTVFYSVALRQEIADEDLPAISDMGVKVQRDYLRLVPGKSNDSYTIKTEPAGQTLKQGDQILVRLTIDSDRDLAYVLIEDEFPSGCEANDRGEVDESTGDWRYPWSDWKTAVRLSYTDVRDDRVAFFARTLAKGKHIIEYTLRVQTPGAYHVLPTVIYPMYAPEVRGESAEARLKVRE